MFAMTFKTSLLMADCSDAHVWQVLFYHFFAAETDHLLHLFQMRLQLKITFICEKKTIFCHHLYSFS